jgi:hypothetical protein
MHDLKFRVGSTCQHNSATWIIKCARMKLNYQEHHVMPRAGTCIDELPPLNPLSSCSIPGESKQGKKSLNQMKQTLISSSFWNYSRFGDDESDQSIKFDLLLGSYATYCQAGDL